MDVEMILPDQERVQAILSDLLVRNEPEMSEGSINEADLLAEIDADTEGKLSVSDAIIQERWEGP